MAHPPNRTRRRRPGRELTAGQFERLTGIQSERARTWNRRYGFPTIGLAPHPYVAAEIPVVIAIKQLIAAGVPASAAVAEARSRATMPQPTTALELSFGQLDVPVVAYEAGAMAGRIYANAAAETSSLSFDEATRRELQQLANSEHGGARSIWVSSGATPEDEREAIAFTLGAPLFAPALVAVVELPAGASRSRDRAARRDALAIERTLTAALAQARRQLQRCEGRAGLLPAFDAVIEGSRATDGFLILRSAAGLLCSVSRRGAMPPPRLPARMADHLQAETGAAGHAWLADPLVASLGKDGACLAIPMRSGGAELGYACFVHHARLPYSDVAYGLLESFADMEAAVIARVRG